jgi:hypothetical protein
MTRTDIIDALDQRECDWETHRALRETEQRIMDQIHAEMVTLRGLLAGLDVIESKMV